MLFKKNKFEFKFLIEFINKKIKMAHTSNTIMDEIKAKCREEKEKVIKQLEQMDIMRRIVYIIESMKYFQTRCPQYIYPPYMNTLFLIKFVNKLMGDEILIEKTDKNGRSVAKTTKKIDKKIRQLFTLKSPSLKNNVKCQIKTDDSEEIDVESILFKYHSEIAPKMEEWLKTAFLEDYEFEVDDHKIFKYFE